ncbi:hypothetical protein TNCV_3033661 [Trichonephila clavipes]|nr:hypothetical protein TNCV_3033661 [Trichonephila clavipes]
MSRNFYHFCPTYPWVSNLLGRPHNYQSSAIWVADLRIVRVHYFCERGGFVGYRSRASSNISSPHLPVGSLDSSGSNRGCAGSEAARVGVESTKKPTPDVVVVFET